MKKNRFITLILGLLLLLSACAAPVLPEKSGVSSAPPAPAQSGVSDNISPPDTSAPPPEPPGPQEVGDIRLYGEEHGVKDILDEELRLWTEAYDRGARHLFIEYPYYTAELLNLWMAAEDDELLEGIYADWMDTQAYNKDVKTFYQQIKADCPGTVFHGTDVGHQYQSTGERYLNLLRESGREDSEEYQLAQACVEQGRSYYAAGNVLYREKCMVQNFIRALDALEGEEVMGFYGAAHIGTAPFSYDGQTVHSTMAAQLLERYGERLHLTDLSALAVPDLKPERTGSIQVGEKVYEASCFGQVDISSWSEVYLCREFWRLEGAYEDLQDAPRTGNVLPYNNYPTRVEEGQVYVIDYTRRDGTAERQYFISDGTVWQGMPSTVQIVPEQ